MRQLVNGFYEDVVGKTEDELITEVCTFNDYTLITKSFKDVIVFRDSKGQMISISNADLVNHTKENVENKSLKKELERMGIQKEESRKFWATVSKDRFKMLTDEQLQNINMKALRIDWSSVEIQPYTPLYGLFDEKESE